MTRFTVSLLVFLGAFVLAMAGQAHADPIRQVMPKKARRFSKNACRAT